MVRMVEMDAGAVESHDGIPRPGERLNFNDDELVVLSTKVENRRKVILKTHPLGEVKTFDDPMANSVDWDEISEEYIEEVKHD